MRCAEATFVRRFYPHQPLVGSWVEGYGGRVSAYLELDDRRRVSLGKIGRREHTRYLVDEEPDGTLIFRPAVVMAEAQARLLERGETVEAIDAFLDDPSQGVRRDRPGRRQS